MRYSIPERLIKRIWEDNDFFNAVCKEGRIQANRFPKNDQWADEENFHMSFALAGYAPEDILLEISNNVLTLSSKGISETPPEQPEISENDDAMDNYSRTASLAVQKGVISRGIARRSFRVSYAVSKLFDCYGAHAKMEHGLLHIVVPAKEQRGIKVVNIMENK